jgi:hypothetical protein
MEDSSDPEVCPAVQESLSALVAAMGHDEQVRRAGHPDTDPELLLALAELKEAYVWEALAGNPSSTEDVHLRVLSGADWLVRCAVAGAEGVGTRVVKVLAEDENENVRFWLVRNLSAELDASLPVAYLEESTRGVEFVAAAARRAGVDADTRAALRPGWSGTLEELLESCTELAGEGSPERGSSVPSVGLDHQAPTVSSTTTRSMTGGGP